MALCGNISVSEFENYAAAQAGVDKVHLIEGDPIFVKSFSLIPFNLIGTGIVYRNREGENYVVLVPFGGIV